MARKPRIEYSGAIYHVMNRGDRREAIFHDDSDRELFVETLGEACEKTEWQVLAYCLMGNHFHAVIETPAGNLVAGMKWFLGTYTARFNRRHEQFGHLFSGRYKALIVDSEDAGYLRTVCEYVHLNPVRAKLLRRKQPLRDYRWSSFPAYLEAPSRRPTWLRVERTLGDLGIPKDSAAGRKEFERLTEKRRREGVPKDYAPIRRGWFLGSDDFGKELLGRIEERRGPNHYGVECLESAEEKAERLLAQGLKERRWSEADLSARRKGDAGKVKLAMRLRRETTMTLKWIADRLKMGTWTNLSNLLSQERRSQDT
jgi:REP element-mobilizing transposase RayT